MSRYWALIGVTASALGLLFLFGFSRLELYHRIRQIPASREVRADPFYALEKWLGSSGHPVRLKHSGDSAAYPAGFIRALGGREGVVFFESSFFHSWDEAGEVFLPWLREGGSLIISLNPSWDEGIDEELLGFFGSLGIRVEDRMNLPDSEEETGDEDRPGNPGETDEAGEETPQPFFHWRFRFSPSGKDPAGENLAARLILTGDREGSGRVAELSLGNGSLTVMGLPLFMYNDSLEEDANARLAWDLTAGKTTAERPEILFVRGGQPVKSLTGRLLERGNLLPPLAAALVLILTGFWMLIPSFGIPRREKPEGRRSIRERFRAEARFLKRHRSLGVYAEAYIREIEYRGRTRNQETAGLLAPAKAALSSKKKLSYREAIRLLESLMGILEHL
ncbi:MAG: hypothetical protein LBL70_01240 [Treponema sp.]|jgi:hypothetical protein|nr:hypothetical protein [Treponema sp.]